MMEEEDLPSVTSLLKSTNNANAKTTTAPAKPKKQPKKESESNKSSILNFFGSKSNPIVIDEDDNASSSNRKAAVVEDDDYVKDEVSATPKAKEEAEGEGSKGPKKISNSVNLILPPKIGATSANTFIMQATRPELDLTGDIGAVGVMDLNQKDKSFSVDMKGILFKAHVIPTSTFLLVSVSGNDAKIESVIEQGWHLEYLGNMMDSEIMDGQLEMFNDEDDLDMEIESSSGKPSKKSAAKITGEGQTPTSTRKKATGATASPTKPRMVKSGGVKKAKTKKPDRKSVV